MDPFLYALLRAVVLQMKRILYYGGTETTRLLLKCNTPCETTVVRTLCNGTIIQTVFLQWLAAPTSNSIDILVQLRYKVGFVLSSVCYVLTGPDRWFDVADFSLIDADMLQLKKYFVKSDDNESGLDEKDVDEVVDEVFATELGACN